jgi:putative toxin-antitoxin system antitoxin component (TIGR02293 family)
MGKVQHFAQAVAEAALLLREPEPSWDAVVDQLYEPVRWLHGLTESEKQSIEPFLISSALEAVTASWLALSDQNRRDARLAVERLRQSLNDIAAAEEVGDTRDPAEIVSWIAAMLGFASAQRVGEAAGVSARTWQRWIARDKPPSGEQAERLRATAQVLAHLRHAFTPAGCLAWLERPHPMLDDEVPKDVLNDPTRVREVIDVAAGSRVQSAA